MWSVFTWLRVGIIGRLLCECGVEPSGSDATDLVSWCTFFHVVILTYTRVTC
jgi:hypothetical protein